MSFRIDGFRMTANAAGAIAVNLRVTLDGSGNVALATNTDVWIGVAETPAAALNDQILVRIRANRVETMVCSAAVTIGAAVYGAAGGKISGTVAGAQTGFALLAGSGDNAQIPVLLL